MKAPGRRSVKACKSKSIRRRFGLKENVLIVIFLGVLSSLIASVIYSGPPQWLHKWPLPLGREVNPPETLRGAGSLPKENGHEKPSRILIPVDRRPDECDDFSV